MRSHRGALLVATTAIGAVALVGAARPDAHTLAASVPVPSGDAPAVVPPGGAMCDGIFRLPVDVNGAQLPLVTGGRPGPPLRVVLRDRVGRALVETRIPGGYRATGYRDLPVTTARFATVAAGRRIAVCLENGGGRPVALYAGKSQNSRRSHGISLVEVGPGSHSLLSVLPRVAERAALFRPRGVGPWTFWLLSAGLLVAVPGLLAIALAAAARPRGDAA